VQAYVTRTFDPIAAADGLRFEIDADPQLPETILTDEQRLEQILRNLLSNAFKFTEAGGVTLRIRQLVGSRISFSVSDTGVGIPPDKLQVIFEAFQQADGTTSRKYGGTGLGLSISRELARALGGEIEVESIVGEGTTFTLTLPLNYARPLGIPSERVPTERVPAERAGSAPRAVPQRAGSPPAGPGGERDGSGDGPTHREAAPAGVDGGAATLEEVPGTQSPPAPALAPVAADAAEDRAQGDASAERAQSAHGLVASRTLIVERGGALRAALAEHAARAGQEQPAAVASLQQARAALASGHYELIVLGAGVAKRSKLSFLQQLDADPGSHAISVIVLADRPFTEREQKQLQELSASLAVKVLEDPEQLCAAAAAALAGEEREGEPAGELERHAAARLRGKKVLLVDDDVRNLFALASLLEDRGMEVVFGETGREALAALERHHDVDIVLMDIMMPDMDGNETIEAIRREPRLGTLPIIAVTAKAMEGDRERSLTAGASDYITKPVEPERLLSRIASWLA
jgi:CheY-like chemotaxis protein